MTDNEFKITPSTIEPNYVSLGQDISNEDTSVGSYQPNALGGIAPVTQVPTAPTGSIPYHTHNGTDSPLLQLIALGIGTNSFRLSPNQGMWMGAETFAAAPFRVDMQGNLVATSATITIATLGGFNIGSDYIRDAANSMGIASTVTGSDDVRFWAGDTFANRATAPFRAYESGAVTMNNVTITGGSITGAGMVSVIALNLANRGWTQTCAFTVTDADTVAWGAGSFVTGDGGTTLSISAGNTGNMSAKTYIYLDANVSLTAYQTTTTATTAVGASKVLIAIAQNGTGEATFQVLSGMGGQNIDAGSIVANSITANELSTSITYAGTIVVDTAGVIRSGMTNYMTGTGWWLGNAAGTPKFSIGNPSLDYISWDGTTLTVSGVQKVIQHFTADEDLTAGDMVGISNYSPSSSVARALRTTTTATVGMTGSQTLRPSAHSCPIGGSKFVIIDYEVSSDGGIACVGSINTSTKTLSVGTASGYSSDLDAFHCVCKLDTDKFIVFYKQDASATIVKYNIATVSGTTISWSGTTTFYTAGSTITSLSCDQLGTDKGILSVGAGATNSVFIAFTVSGTTPTVGTPIAWGTSLDNNTSAQRVRKLDTDKFVAISSGTGTWIQVGTVSGTTITLGTDTQVSATTNMPNDNEIVVLTTSLVIVHCVSNSNIPELTAVTISGTTPTIGTPLTGTQYGYTSAKDSATSFVVGINDPTGVDTMRKYTVSGTTITDAGIIINKWEALMKLLTLDSGVLIGLELTTTTLTAWIQGMSNYFIGAVESTVSKGNTASIITAGKVGGYSGLIQGAIYKVITGGLTQTGTGAATSTTDDIYLIAASTTEIIIN